MSSKFAVVALVAASALIAPVASAQQSHTTRIEPRAYYGAVVTKEAGVRVFRPLPPDRHVIINPGGKTPLALGVGETNVYDYPGFYNDPRRSSDY